MNRKKSLASAAAIVLAASLAACGGSSGGGDQEDRKDMDYGEAASSFEQVPDATGPAPEVEGAVTGGTITYEVPLDQGPEDIDPTNGWSVLGNSILQDLVHRSLTQYRRNAETGNMELVPDLATDLGTSNDDFTEWTFTLRDGVRWETGDPVTAEEIKYGLERSMDIETFTGGPGYAYSAGWFDCGEGYSGPQDGDCPGITVDGRTITIKMVKPFSEFPWYSTFMAMGPIPEKDSEFPAYGRAPLATGPYKVESFRPGESLVLVKNDQWDPATDPARHQYADKWVINFDADQEKTDQLLLSGSGGTTISNRVGSTNVAEMQAALGSNFLQQPGGCVSYRSPDYTKITDINVRKAIAYAYDWENVLIAQGEVPGVTRVPASSIMPPGMAGRREVLVDGEQIAYDPEKARSLLEEAGQVGFKLTYIYDDSQPEYKAANDQEMKGYIAAGFEVEAIPYQEDEYDLYQDADSPINKKLNLRKSGWCYDWPSGSTMIPPLYKTGQPYNTAFFSEKEIDDRMEEIGTLPIEEQADAWGALDEQILTEYFPSWPTAYRNDLFAAGSDIGGFSGNAAMSAISFKDLYVIE
ncbi:ABC transporter substrate-binding protein [Alloalcanivorax gelatiniphagus]